MGWKYLIFMRFRYLLSGIRLLKYPIYYIPIANKHNIIIPVKIANGIAKVITGPTTLITFSMIVYFSVVRLIDLISILPITCQKQCALIIKQLREFS